MLREGRRRLAREMPVGSQEWRRRGRSIATWRGETQGSKTRRFEKLPVSKHPRGSRHRPSIARLPSIERDPAGQDFGPRGPVAGVEILRWPAPGAQLKRAPRGRFSARARRSVDDGRSPTRRGASRLDDEVAAGKHSFERLHGARGPAHGDAVRVRPIRERDHDARVARR
jgi:hypothetical protein